MQEMTPQSVITFKPSFSLLQDEGHLFEAALTQGLTKIRNASITNKGDIYSGLFNLSIGIERVQKVIIIIDYMLENSMKTPTSKEIKSWNHKLTELHAKVIDISNKHKVTLPGNEITKSLINQFSNFAKVARYYNFDKIGNDIRSSNPIADWCALLHDYAENEIPKRYMKKILDAAKRIESSLPESFFFAYRGVDNDTMTREQTFANEAIEKMASKHIIIPIMKIIIGYRDLLSQMCMQVYSIPDRNPAIPQMQEFFGWSTAERSYCLRKRIWP